MQPGRHPTPPLCRLGGEGEALTLDSCVRTESWGLPGRQERSLCWLTRPGLMMSPGILGLKGAHRVWEEGSLERWVSHTPQPQQDRLGPLPLAGLEPASLASGMIPATMKALRGPRTERGACGLNGSLSLPEAGGWSHPATGRAEAFSAPPPALGSSARSGVPDLPPPHWRAMWLLVYRRE